MSQKRINVGIIGLGMIGRVHARAYKFIAEELPDSPFAPNVTAVLRSRAGADEPFLAEIGNPLVTTSDEEFYKSPLNLVDICTPNFLHKVQSEKALARGLDVYCEKPLAKTVSEAWQMEEQAVSMGVQTHTAFVYRYLPAMQMTKELIAAGEIGRPQHFRCKIFHNRYLNPELPMAWRLQRAIAGGGALVDIGIHAIDLLHYTMGEIAWVQCAAKTFIKQRPLPDSPAQLGEVDVDDWALCMIGMKNGAVGSIEASRMAGGKLESTLQIFASNGSIDLNFDAPLQLPIYEASSGSWREINALERDSKTLADEVWRQAETPKDRYFAAHVSCIYDFLLCLERGQRSDADFSQSLRIQEILAAAYKSAMENGRRIEV